MKIISTETDNVGASSSTTTSARLPVNNPDRSYHSNDSASLGSDSDTDDDQPTQKAVGKPGPDISKTNWKQSSTEHLKSLVSKAKGGVSKAALAFIKSTMKDTKLIFVMGKSGTGKSSLLNELTGMDLHVGKSLESGTRQFYVCPAVIDNQQYLFIDTAGFGAADMDDEGNFQDIMTCLETLRPFVTFAGVLFVYGQMERLGDVDLLTMRWIECFCGPQFFQNITIITTKWDEFKRNSFQKRWAITADFENEEVVQCLLKPSGRCHGATIYHHGLPGGRGSKDSWRSVLCYEEEPDKRGDELRDLIRRKYAEIDIGELQIIRELNQGRALWDTEAAKVIMSDVKKTIVEVSEENATLVPRLGSSKDCEVSLSAKFDKPRGERNDSGDTKTRIEPEEQTKEQSKQQPDEEVKEQPKKQQKIQAKEGTSWYQRWFRGVTAWYTVLTETAQFFAEARKTGYQSSNREGAKSPPAWSPWKAAWNWWNGSTA